MSDLVIQQSKEIEFLRNQIDWMQQQIIKLQTSLSEARDPNPVTKITIKRVETQLEGSLVRVKRLKKGWLVSFGICQKIHQSLFAIWQIIRTGEWDLHELVGPATPERESTVGDEETENQRTATPQKPKKRVTNYSLANTYRSRRGPDILTCCDRKIPPQPRGQPELVNMDRML